MSQHLLLFPWERHTGKNHQLLAVIFCDRSNAVSGGLECVSVASAMQPQCLFPRATVQFLNFNTIFGAELTFAFTAWFYSKVHGGDAESPSHVLLCEHCGPVVESSD